ncbi:hypothetical protein R8Z50_22305 [Longispora sp. K20-0274]|uniref:hypothetical protein n=1 Tax=Longispora sp. K20-0274 TaxID=3088255 RepID=UPI00399A839E
MTTTGPATVQAPPPPPSQHRRVWTIAAVGALLLALGGAVAIGVAPQTDTRPPAGSPWELAGLTALDLSATHGPNVVVRGVTREPLGDAGAQARYGRRLAKLAWRNIPTRLDTLTFDVAEHGGPHAVHGLWTRDQLLAAFGERHAGLDAGDGPGRPPQIDGPYRHRTATTTSDGTTLVTELLTSTARRYLGYSGPITPTTNPPQTCVGGKPGTARAELIFSLEVPDQAESLLPGIEDLWIGLGLDLAGGDLDSGMPTVGATLPPAAGLGHIAAFTDPDHPHTLHLAGSSGCLLL